MTMDSIQLSKHHAVVISEKSRAELQCLAQARNGCKDPSWTRRKTDVFSDEEVDTLGLYGEYAVASYLGMPLDETISSSGDNGHDLMWCGRTAAVKFNHRWDGFLMVEERAGDDPGNGKINDLSADIIILTHGNCDPPKACYCRDPHSLTVVVAGWMWREDFIRRMEYRNWGLGGRYTCRARELRPMYELVRMAPRIHLPETVS